MYTCNTLFLVGYSHKHTHYVANTPQMHNHHIRWLSPYTPGIILYFRVFTSMRYVTYIPLKSSPHIYLLVPYTLDIHFCDTPLHDIHFCDTPLHKINQCVWNQPKYASITKVHTRFVCYFCDTPLHWLIHTRFVCYFKMWIQVCMNA